MTDLTAAFTTTLSMAMTVMMVPISQGVAAMGNAFQCQAIYTNRAELHRESQIYLQILDAHRSPHNQNVNSQREKIQMIVVAFCIIFNTRAKRLQNIVNGEDHVTIIHVFNMSIPYQ
ncbi:hypothetical protein PNOK_0004600 [Pyrrhoderma noxium]|uniref:Uncharacterized protein n=1 Tax=Pyrrhoderma noxium TaxID=2282107 RepID=A0A286UTT0_9AGAM|nr:hypothetical protein PNOK_0004600 [Pyrrhoderma noxium]